MALGGESSTLVLSSMECFTLGYDGWRCSIPTAVALSGKTRRIIFFLKVCIVTFLFL